MATPLVSRILLALTLVVIPLHLVSLGFRVFRRSRFGRLRAIHSAAFLLFIPILLSAIFGVPEVNRLPEEERGVSELGELKQKISRLESIFEKNIEDLNSKVLLLQEKDRLIEEMSRKIQYLLDFLRNMKSCGTVCAHSTCVFKQAQGRNGDRQFAGSGSQGFTWCNLGFSSSRKLSLFLQNIFMLTYYSCLIDSANQLVSRVSMIL